MADLPITSDQGATPIVINDPTTVTNVANVKAASTATVAGDNSLVVALSPNSPLPTGTNNIGITGVVQGSTTSGEHGDLVQGAVTTAAPSYTTGQTNPLSLDTSGNLRVIAESGSTTAVTGNVTVVQSTGSNLNADVYVDGLTSFQSRQVTVGTSAVQIDATPLATRSAVIIKALPTNSGIVYIGQSIGVTASTGFPLLSDDTLSMDITSAAPIYAIASLASQIVSLVEAG